MPGFTIAAAARVCGVDRRTLQRAIHAGRLQLDAQHCLSREDLIAAGYLVADTPQGMPQETPRETPQMTALLALVERLTTAVEGVYQELRHLRDLQGQMPQYTPRETPLRTPRGERRKGVTTPREMPQVRPRESNASLTTPRVEPQDRPQVTPQPSPQILGTYDPQAAAARIQTLRQQGLSLTRIAAILTEEGIPTRYGLPWQYSSVRHLLKTYGE